MEHDAKSNALIIEHMTFARQLAAQFYQQRSNFGFDRDDFEGAALLGLCDAARRFDPKKGEYFKTFSYFRIRGAMFDLLRNGAGVQRRQFNQIVANREHTEDSEKIRKLPYSFANSAHELAGLVNILDGLSMQLHISDGGHVEMSYADQLNPEDAATVNNSRRRIEQMIQELPERERAVIVGHYYEGQSFAEIGRELGGLSRSWVCRLHSSAIRQLHERVQAIAPDSLQLAASGL